MHTIKKLLLTYYLNIGVQAANLSDCQIESNRENRFGSENRIESKLFFARIGMLYCRARYALVNDFERHRTWQTCGQTDADGHGTVSIHLGLPRTSRPAWAAGKTAWSLINTCHSRQSEMSWLYIGWNDVTESMVTIRSPFCGYNLAYWVELIGEDLPCYSNKF